MSRATVPPSGSRPRDALVRIVRELGRRDLLAGRHWLRSEGHPLPPELAAPPPPALSDAEIEKVLADVQMLDISAEEKDALRRWWVGSRTAPRPGTQERSRHAVARLDEVLDAVHADERALLDRLGASPAATPAASTYALLQRIPDLTTRRRVVEARRGVRGRHLDAFVAAFDTLVACSGPVDVPADVAEDFADQCLASAVQDLPALRDDLAETLRESPADVVPSADVGHTLRLRAERSQGVALVPAALGMAVACGAARDILGADVDARLVQPDHAWEVVVRDDRDTSRIGVRLRPDRLRPNLTVGLLNRLDDGHTSRGAVSHVETSWTSRTSGMLTLQDTLSLFHELGHAFAHALAPGRLPLTTSLESFAPERAELLPLWFERQARTATLLDHLDDVDRQRGLIALKETERRASFLERAVVARLELAVHGFGRPSLAAAWADLERRHDLGRDVLLVDLFEALTSPPHRARPGTAWTYPWASAQVEAHTSPDDRATVASWVRPRSHDLAPAAPTWW